MKKLSPYMGAGIAYSETLSPKWRFHGTVRLGYAHQNDISLDRGGFGIFVDLGIDYKISRHWGVGLVIKDCSTIFSLKELSGHASFNNMLLNAAVSYYF